MSLSPELLRPFGPSRSLRSNVGQLYEVRPSADDIRRRSRRNPQGHRPKNPVRSDISRSIPVGAVGARRSHRFRQASDSVDQHRARRTQFPALGRRPASSWAADETLPTTHATPQVGCGAKCRFIKATDRRFGTLARSTVPGLSTPSPIAGKRLAKQPHHWRIQQAWVVIENSDGR